MSLAKNKLFHDKREHNFQINHLNVNLNKKIVSEKKLSPNYFCRKNQNRGFTNKSNLQKRT